VHRRTLKRAFQLGSRVELISEHREAGIAAHLLPLTVDGPIVAGIQRRPILGGLIYGYERAA
jgi:hypothetical protein